MKTLGDVVSDLRKQFGEGQPLDAGRGPAEGTGRRCACALEEQGDR